MSTVELLSVLHFVTKITIRECFALINRLFGRISCGVGRVGGRETVRGRGRRQRAVATCLTSVVWSRRTSKEGVCCVKLVVTGFDQIKRTEWQQSSSVTHMLAERDFLGSPRWLVRLSGLYFFLLRRRYGPSLSSRLFYHALPSVEDAGAGRVRAGLGLAL